jgi:hypothetical protein
MSPTPPKDALEA